MGVGVAVSVRAHACAAGRLQARVVAGAMGGLAIALLLLTLASAPALAAPTWGVASEIQQPPDKTPGVSVSFLCESAAALRGTAPPMAAT